MKKLSPDTIKALDKAAILLGKDWDALQAFMNEKSDTWLDSKAGENYQAWVDEIEAIMDALEGLQHKLIEDG